MSRAEIRGGLDTSVLLITFEKSAARLPGVRVLGTPSAI